MFGKWEAIMKHHERASASQSRNEWLAGRESKRINYHHLFSDDDNGNFFHLFSPFVPPLIHKLPASNRIVG